MTVFTSTLRTALWCLCTLLMAGAVLAQTMASQESSAPEPSQALGTGAVAGALRSGGYVVYFRHTATDFSKNDADMKGYADCANPRLLSPQGRSEARDIGRSIARLKLPVGEVFASPLCRTMDTARLMLGRATPRADMRESDGADYPGLKQLLAAPVAAGSNRWLIGHGNPFRAVAGAPHLAEGEAAVIRPGGTVWTVVARVMPTDWAQLK
ncbi:MAG: histidine phosphatase family protein [Burkholderiaceae bacterium]